MTAAVRHWVPLSSRSPLSLSVRVGHDRCAIPVYSQAAHAFTWGVE